MIDHSFPNMLHQMMKKIGELAMENKIVSKEIEVDNTLASMALSKPDLLEAILYGASEKENNHAESKQS